MRTLCSVLAAVTVLAVTSPVAAQSSPDGFQDEISGQFEASARKVVSLAEAMPADKYSWAPMEGVATVVSVYMHIARYNYMYPQENLGIESPMGAAAYGRWEAEVTDKAEAVAILAASMDHVRGVIDGMSDADLNAETRLYGRQVGEWAVLLQLVAHMNEHLGQSIAYARMNRVVPPWSS
jgi:uncharacterized damage-inducible protein DinB